MLRTNTAPEKDGEPKASARSSFLSRLHRISEERGNDMDEDLAALNREALIAEIKRLRNGIREHRDSSGHELCWHHPKLWGLLPEKSGLLPSVPAWPQFLRDCIKYRESLDQQLPNAPRSVDEFSEDPR
jgi:hypothetical protein